MLKALRCTTQRLTSESNLLLLLHRPRITGSDAAGGFENDNESWKIAFDGARAITLITECIMNYKSLYQCPLF